MVGRHGSEVQKAILICIALIFYGFSAPDQVHVLVIALAANYFFSRLVFNARSDFSGKVYLALGVCFALGLLGYFKYKHFIFANVSTLFDMSYQGEPSVIPVGISFYTFTSIAFLVDIANKRINRFSAIDYATTITYFPHLVAGPILFHHDTLPQLQEKQYFNWTNVQLFVLFFTVGLFKKAGLADTISQFCDPIFLAVANGAIPDIGQAWRGALCYTLQLYFDFSGYSDMAIGLACLFGIKIPINFYSPYKSKSISEFWQKWHISLGYFFRTYLYIPLGGNRLGTGRTLLNLFIVMFLCGVWHGAGWTFVLWGAMHGVALIIHKIVSGLCKKNCIAIPSIISIVITFLFVTFAWVVFRSDCIGSAKVIILAMVGMGGTSIPGLPFKNAELWIAFLLFIVWCLPNMYQLVASKQPGILHGKDVAYFAETLIARGQDSQLLQMLSGAGFAILFVAGILFLVVNGQSNYLYFDF